MGELAQRPKEFENKEITTTYINTCNISVTKDTTNDHLTRKKGGNERIGMGKRLGVGEAEKEEKKLCRARREIWSFKLVIRLVRTTWTGTTGLHLPLSEDGLGRFLLVNDVKVELMEGVGVEEDILEIR